MTSGAPCVSRLCLRSAMTAPHAEVSPVLQPALVFTTSLAGLLLGVSDAVEGLLGIPPDGLIGQTLREVVEPSDRATVETLFQAVRAGQRRGSITLGLRHSSGQRVPITGHWVSLSSCDADTTVTFLCATAAPQP